MGEGGGLRHDAHHRRERARHRGGAARHDSADARRRRRAPARVFRGSRHGQRQFGPLASFRLGRRRERGRQRCPLFQPREAPAHPQDRRVRRRVPVRRPADRLSGRREYLPEGAGAGPEVTPVGHVPGDPPQRSRAGGRRRRPRRILRRLHETAHVRPERQRGGRLRARRRRHGEGDVAIARELARGRRSPRERHDPGCGHPISRHKRRLAPARQLLRF